eukprot:3573174-Amphidinium_carterae.1
MACTSVRACGLLNPSFQPMDASLEGQNCTVPTTTVREFAGEKLALTSPYMSTAQSAQMC